MNKWFLTLCFCLTLVFVSCENEAKAPYVEVVSMYKNKVFLSDWEATIPLDDTLTVWINLYGYDNNIERLDVSLNRNYAKDSVFLSSTERGLYCDSYDVATGAYVFGPGTKNLQIPLYIMPHTLPADASLPQILDVTLKTDVKNAAIGANPYTMSLKYYISE